MTRYVYVKSVLSHPEIFSSRDTLLPVVTFTPEVFQVLATGFGFPPNIINTDGSEHTRFRVPLNRAFLPARLKSMEAGNAQSTLAALALTAASNALLTRLEHLSICQGLQGADALRAVFPHLHYLWVRRRDKVRQAISQWKAIQTWIWRTDLEALQASRSLWAMLGEPPNRITEPRYSFEAINYLARLFEQQDEQWRRYFAPSGIEPLVIEYEELERDYSAMVQRVLHFLDLSLLEPALPGPVTLRKQADAISDLWIDQYYDQLQQEEDDEQEVS